MARHNAIKAVYGAATADEALRLRKEFVDASAGSGCPQMESMFLRQAAELSPQLTYGVQPTATGAAQKLQVERVDAAGNVLQAYEWPILPAKVTPVATETEWIVSEVASRMSSLLGHESVVSVKAKTNTPHVFEVSGLGATRPSIVTLEGGPWNPANYVGIAKALGITGGDPAQRVYSNDMLHALTTPTIETLLAVNTELGLAFRSDPRNALTHEASALLAVTVALRASGTGLEDVRPLLNRASAHLAFSMAASNRHLGPEGEMARVGIEVLSGRQVAAAAMLKRSRARMGSASARTWYRSLMMRATGDWRVYRASKNATLLEQLEHARALNRSWTSERAADFFQAEGLHRQSPVWARAILAHRNSVEVGNTFGGTRLELEMAEAAKLAHAYGEEDVFRFLQTTGKSAGLEPISTDLWARLAEGSVADAAWKFNEHLNGLPPSAEGESFRDQMGARFPDSPVFQALVHWWGIMGSPSRRAERCPDLAKWIRAEPFRLSARAHGFAASACGHMGRAFPAVSARITPWTLEGTLFDFKNRLTVGELLRQTSDSDWRALRGMAFYDPEILGFAVGEVEKREPTSADYRKFTHERAYSLAMFRSWRYVTSTRGDVREALEPGRAACRLDATECLELINVLRAQRLDDEAFATAVRGFGPGAHISVNSSNSSAWVVDEAARRGQLKLARDIASRVAETGSYVGLLVRARFVESVGELERAGRLYQELDTMYHATESQAFELRQMARQGRSHEELAAALADMGQPLRMQFFKTKEEVHGLSVEPTWLEEIGAPRRLQASAMGLKPGDMITRVNGFDIANAIQFWAALSLSDETAIQVTVRSSDRGIASEDFRGAFWHARYGAKRPSP